MKSLFVGIESGESPRPTRDEKAFSAAALLVEAAAFDDRVDSEEMATIRAILTDRFALSPEEAGGLLEEARNLQATSNDLHGFTRRIKEHFPPEERIGIIEMLWEVAYADGELHDFEANLLRRVCGLIYVSDSQSGAARKRVLARLGLE
ncbi:TerB family tellurite resistance protein [Oceanibacterium hippocampi]|uniref:tellurite resistance TerB family protein n=1 Tax=Oceanibacterium hippocampi TaxID=745714 RepID=UPI0015931205|nr:TerB family tellurite resistance protein [Oceanibacterium hippocampi]